MEKEMGITEARVNLSGIIEQVQFKGNTFIINRHGKPAAVVVPLAVYESWKRQRKIFFKMIREMQQRSDLDPGEAELLGIESVSESRTEGYDPG
jgi:prevent-host-death family protein